MDSLAEILEELRGSRQGEILSVAPLRARWADVAGELAGSGEPVRVRNGTLWIRCPDGAAAQEWHFRQEQVLARLRQVFPQAEVERLKIRA